MSTVYVCESMLDGVAPRLLMIGEPTINQAMATGNWPDVDAKRIVLDHESLFWMLPAGFAWGSANQAANKIRSIVQSAKASYPDSKIGVYGLPFVPASEFGWTPSPETVDWIRSYHALAVQDADFLCPSGYPTADPRSGADEGERQSIRSRFARHSARTVFAATDIANGRETILFTSPRFAGFDGNPARMPTPTEFAAQATSAGDAGIDVAVWTYWGWMLDIACAATCATDHPLAKKQIQFRTQVDFDTGQPRDWESPGEDALRSMYIARGAFFVRAAAAELERRSVAKLQNTNVITIGTPPITTFYSGSTLKEAAT